MASNDDYQHTINDREGLELGHRMLLAEQQRRLESRRILEASTRAPVCPNYSVIDHSGCWYCRQHGTPQPSTSTDNLLKSLARPQFQTTPISATPYASYLPSSASTDGTVNPLNQLITPASTASIVPLTHDRPQRQSPSDRMIYSKPRAPVLTPTPTSGPASASRPASASGPAPASRPAPASKPAAAATPITKPVKLKPDPARPFTELQLPKNFARPQIPATFSRFLHLPVEIRHLIYAHVVDNGVHGILLPSKDVKVYHQAAITRVNRQIRRESIDLVYTNNAFNATSRDLIKRGLMLSQNIGDNKLNLIKSWTWITAKRSLDIWFPNGQGAVIDHNGSNDEVKAVALERCRQVCQYLNGLGHHTTGLGAGHVKAITEIVLRITPKQKAKKEGETVQ